MKTEEIEFEPTNVSDVYTADLAGDLIAEYSISTGLTAISLASDPSRWVIYQREGNQLTFENSTCLDLESQLDVFDGKYSDLVYQLEDVLEIRFPL